MTRVLGRVIMGAREGRAPILALPLFRSGVLRAILAIKGPNHGLGRIWQRYTSCEFKRDAVRIAQSSGLKRRRVASDLGLGHSTLGKWVRAFSEDAKVPA